MNFDLTINYDRFKAEEYFKKLMDKGEKIELKKFVGSRTNLQNRYFHVCCKILGDYAGYTVDEIKVIIKEQLDFMKYTKGKHTFLRSTAELDKDEFIALIDYIRSFADQYGCTIPTSEEFNEYQFEIEKQYT